MDIDGNEVLLEEYKDATPGTMTKRLVEPLLQDAIRTMGKVCQLWQLALLFSVNARCHVHCF